MSEEEKTLISMLNIVDTYIEDTKVTKVIFSMEDAKILYDLIKRLQKETEREKQYSDFYKDLCNKYQKKIKELKEEQSKRSWVHVKENGEVEPLFYISKDKIREKLNQIHNEFSDVLLDKTLSLEEQNLNAHRYDAIRNVLEELLEEK